MKRGFTLVELSIVLVIIGLLIGGILAAQSMISTARLQAVIRQIQQFDAVVNNFQTKYNAMPGDAVAFGGNGDGLIDMAVPDTYYKAIIFDGEVANAWVSLQQSGFQSSKPFTSTVTTAIDYTSNTPNVPRVVGFDAGAALSDCSGDQGSDSDLNDQSPQVNCYTLARFINDRISTGKAAFTPAEALSIDVKIDDGILFSGSVQHRVGEIAGSQLSTGCNQSSPPYDYDLTNTSIACFLAIGVNGANLGEGKVI